MHQVKRRMYRDDRKHIPLTHTAAAPHLLCSWRGLASLPSLPIGLLMRRKWDSVLAKASLFSTCKHDGVSANRQGLVFAWKEQR